MKCVIPVVVTPLPKFLHVENYLDFECRRPQLQPGLHGSTLELNCDI